MKLELNDVRTALISLPNWRVEITPYENIVREWQGQSFRQVFELMTEIATVAEEMNHHPDWYNSFRRLTIRLTTHDVGGLSNLDLEMAQKIERLIERKEAQ